MTTARTLGFLATAIAAAGCSSADVFDLNDGLGGGGPNVQESCPESDSPEICAVVDLVNAERADRGLSALGYDSALARAAEDHARDMAENSYFSHTSQDGREFDDRADAAGYTGFATAENIAQGQRNASAVMDSWMTSDGHRANILSRRSNEIGVGLYQRYWVQVFGSL
jgi:uncharacterized protein YkwD